MTLLAKLLLFVAALAGTIPGLKRQWREDRPGFIRSVWAFLLFLIYAGAGTTLLIALVPPPSREGANPVALVALMAFIVTWMFFGALWLARLVPRYRELPRWIDRRFGLMDLTLLAIIGACAFSLIVLKTA